MALESNAWLATNNTANREQQHAGVVKPREEQALGQVTQQNFVGGSAGGDDVSQGQQRGLLKIPSSVGKCSMFTQTEHTNRKTGNFHILTFDRVVWEFKEAGSTMESNDIICHLLLTMPTEYDALATTIEIVRSDQLTLSFVKGQLFDEETK
ncbi:hypothetical protein PR048_008550 [Dryococelus australis]|uniref:Uncharacterized protein n=1 Tax=Dryococelus australis TaxID=614101 RepID=A0ABQ9HY78_9NEOP|nr:hypothetical protein PR048_008550 [Dryococelus australis]